MCSIPLSIINLRTNKETAIAINQIYINKDPDFQREYEAWDDKLKTRFIETILIGRAMNPIWTILNPLDNAEEVLDGMHRLTTALDYLNNKFKLNSKYFTDDNRGQLYDKKMFNELSLDDQQKIRNYNFIFNQLDSSYRTDVNKRRDKYEILNRSSRTLNDYEFNKVLYGKFFDIVSIYKDDLKNLFFKVDDKRGELQTEIIDIMVLSNDLPNSWSSVNSLRDKYYEDNLGNSESSVDNYLKGNEENIKNKLNMIKKIITILKDNKFFTQNKKNFNKYYLPYKFIISRLLYKFKTDISLFNRHIFDIIEKIKSEITEVDIQEKLECKTRNAVFQKKLINLIDDTINSSYETNRDKRLFTKIQINSKLKEQNHVCAICKKEKEIYQGDHIIPWSKGGKTDYENLQVLCIICHQQKSAVYTLEDLK
jgi:hypothetical protein